MSSPRSGFRRAAIASWVLAGIGVAGVAGASQLAYAGTLKPVAEEQPTEAAIPAPPAAPVDVPAPPAAPPSTPPAAEPAPKPIVAAPPAPVRQAPVRQAPVRQASVPVYTPAPSYAPTPQYTPPPAPVYVAPPAPVYVAPPAPVYVAPVQQAPVVAAPAPSQGGFPIRHSNTGSGGGGSVSSGNKFTPPHTASRGS